MKKNYLFKVIENDITIGMNAKRTVCIIDSKQQSLQANNLNSEQNRPRVYFYTVSRKWTLSNH